MGPKEMGLGLRNDKKGLSREGLLGLWNFSHTRQWELMKIEWAQA